MLRTRYAMFDFSEILIIFGLALVVLGPKKLPGAAAQIGRWLGRARAMARQFREQLEEEVNSVKDLDIPKRPPPPVYKPPPYPEPASSSTDSGTVTHPAPTESPSEWLAQSGTGATAEAPPELSAAAPQASVPPPESAPQESAPPQDSTPPQQSTLPQQSAPAPPPTRYAHEDPQTSDRSEHERGT